MYHFISGYTAKIAGTEDGIKEPRATFSACFGAPFLPLHPFRYAKMLGQKIKSHQVNVWLINTGWSGGSYGLGERISLKYTRRMISAVHNKELKNTSFLKLGAFSLCVPFHIEGVPSEILIPRNTWSNKEAYDLKEKELVRLYINNLKQYTSRKPKSALESVPNKPDLPFTTFNQLFEQSSGQYFSQS